jgi:tetratricopeptide (TPR) repeat protein
MTLTDVFIEKESFHEALNVIYDMKKNTGEQPYTLNKTCELQSLLNLHTQSMRSCKIAIKKNPRVAENYVYLAQAHEVKGNDKEREWLLKKTQKRFRDNALALREFGRLLKDQGNCHLAIKWLSQSIKINDKDKISHKIFADCNFKSKNYVEALNSYTKQCQLEKMISHEFKTATATLNQQGQFQWAQKYELNMSQCSTFQKKKINSLFESY